MPMDRTQLLCRDRRPRPWGGIVATLLLATCLPANTMAADALLAVATNFNEAATRLQSEFHLQSEHSVTIASGSTGKLYAQILNGAPFHALLAADRERPALLLQNGLAEPGTAFTYAIGRLTLWSPEAGRVDEDGQQTLRNANFRSLALANPSLAPYGAAAKQALQALYAWDEIEAKIVMGENVGQAYALVATGNAELGLVALSAVTSPRTTLAGSRWDVPAELHEPIRQDAVLLRRGAGNPAARDFLAFMQSDAAQAIIRSFGYGVE